jgi:CubicO group peptidase (beta-lactamase class C family)
MKFTLQILSVFGVIILFSCQKNTSDPQPTPVPPVATPMYFPPLTGTDWQTTTAASLGWNENLITNDLYPYLQQKNTKGFIILKNGKIVVEKYFGTFTADSIWYWASAGKTLTSFLTGLAQEDGILNINNKTSMYLGNGWTTAPLAKENLITVKHQLSMSTGLDDGVPDNDCTLPSCLIYKADAGTRWSYHNAPYSLLYKVIENASGQSYNNYFNTKIKSRIGMNGIWINTGYLNVYYSNTRSMARFGLLVLNKGKWDQTAIMNDSNYFNSMVNTSQNINPSYGYLWWLNGKASHMLPQTQFVFSGNLIPTAPADLFAGLGKNDQKVYVVPSQKLVVIRVGESAGNVQLALSSFDSELWGKLKTIIGY